MKYYLAPMEGITGFVYRNAYVECYGGVDKFFTPFISPHMKKILNAGEKRDILPENNRSLPLVPQILTNNARMCGETIKVLAELGYHEINLNLGCPSGTVTAKGKGAGFLKNPRVLDEFFSELFTEISDMEEAMGQKISFSVKTRLGVEDRDEFYQILKVYNKYPISELIIHPRIQTDYYRNKPDWEMFHKAAAESRCPVVYNGDLFLQEDIRKAEVEFAADTDTFMLGRGIIKRPWLLCEEEPKLDQLLRSHDLLLEGYADYLSGDKNILFRMKELWTFLSDGFLESDRYIKKIKKSGNLQEYKNAVQELTRECAMST